uniref:HAT C-terminal dimerisation domain-containing protein n=1 Tax=Monopterus albus TaxID=43700 RepID=A0A3Q3IT65_MONAL
KGREALQTSSKHHNSSMQSETLNQGSLHSEMKLWKEKWLDPLAGYLPTTVLDTLKTSQIRSFSNIETLLRLQVILPFSRRESNFRQGKRMKCEALSSVSNELMGAEVRCIRGSSNHEAVNKFNFIIGHKLYLCV